MEGQEFIEEAAADPPILRKPSSSSDLSPVSTRKRSALTLDSFKGSAKDALSLPTDCRKKRVAFLVGKTQDPVVSVEWLSELGGEWDMLQSDEAVGRYLGWKFGQQFEVDVLRPKVGQLATLGEKLKIYDMIHIMESEQYMGQHDYKYYKAFFAALSPIADHIFPSLNTLSFMMSKVDYITLMQRIGVPHVPTFVISRTNRSKELVKQMEDFGSWLKALKPVPVWLISKPSHSGSRLHVEKWDVATLHRCPLQFLRSIRRLLTVYSKPYVLIQPFLSGLASCEYRLYYINRKFISCIGTQWKENPNPKKREMRRFALGENDSQKEKLKEMADIAQKVVDVMPTDSALYRVDMFEENQKFYVNEIEMIDADLMPEFHFEEVTIVETLAETLAQLTPKARIQNAMIPSVPIPDRFIPLPIPDSVLKECEAILKSKLKGMELCHVPRTLVNDHRSEFEEMQSLLLELLPVSDLTVLVKACLGKGTLPEGLPKQERALASRLAEIASEHLLLEQIQLTKELESSVKNRPRKKQKRETTSTSSCEIVMEKTSDLVGLLEGTLPVKESATTTTLEKKEAKKSRQ